MQPENPRATIWRYMDLEKYEVMLSSGSLYFPNVLLFEDNFEGSLPEQIPKIHDYFIKASTERMYQDILKEKHENAKYLQPVEEILKASANARLFGRGYTFASCWSMGEYESLAMWEKYGKQNKIIVIQSTYEKLDKELSLSIDLSSHFFDESFIGCVKYSDFERENNLVYLLPPTRYFLKRPPFEFEKEVRVVLAKISGAQKYLGFSVALNLANLIQKVRISPSSPRNFLKEVMDLSKKYGFNFPIELSELNKSPVF